MQFTLGITTKYIYCHPTTSMTNNPLPGISSEYPSVLSCEQQIIALSKVYNVNKAYALEHMIVIFSLVATAYLQPYRFLSLSQIK
jgi:hypothetical protein